VRQLSGKHGRGAAGGRVVCPGGGGGVPAAGGTRRHEPVRAYGVAPVSLAASCTNGTFVSTNTSPVSPLARQPPRPSLLRPSLLRAAAPSPVACSHVSPLSLHLEFEISFGIWTVTSVTLASPARSAVLGGGARGVTR